MSGKIVGVVGSCQNLRCSNKVGEGLFQVVLFEDGGRLVLFLLCAPCAQAVTEKKS